MNAHGTTLATVYVSLSCTPELGILPFVCTVSSFLSHSADFSGLSRSEKMHIELNHLVWTKQL